MNININKSSMPHNQFNLVQFVFAGLFGAISRAVYNYSKNHKAKKIIINFALSILTLYPAYLIVHYFKFDANNSLLIGYIFAIIGERVIEFIMKKHEEIFDTIISKRFDNI